MSVNETVLSSDEDILRRLGFRSSFPTAGGLYHCPAKLARNSGAVGWVIFITILFMLPTARPIRWPNCTPEEQAAIEHELSV